MKTCLLCADVMAADDLDWWSSERQGHGDFWNKPEEEGPLRHHALPQEPPHQSLWESGLPAESRRTGLGGSTGNLNYNPHLIFSSPQVKGREAESSVSSSATFWNLLTTSKTLNILKNTGPERTRTNTRVYSFIFTYSPAPQCKTVFPSKWRLFFYTWKEMHLLMKTTDI